MYLAEDLNLKGEGFSLSNWLIFMGIKIIPPHSLGMPPPPDAKPVAQT